MPKLNLSKSIIIIIVIILVVIISVFVFSRRYQVEPPETISPVIEEPLEEELNSESSAHIFGPSKKIEEVVPVEIRGQILEAINAAFEKEVKERPEAYQFRTSRDNIIYAEEVDLQGDGVQEYIVFPAVLNWHDLRGASDNGPIYILSKGGDGWRVIGRFSGNVVIKEGEKTDGYHNLSTSWHLSAGESMIDDYIWNGAEYIRKESQE